MITITKQDGSTINVPILKDAVHEQELMKSNFIRLSWNDRSLYTIPVGSYIMHDGVKYMLLDPYTPKKNRHKSFTYTPEFQHPIIWLGRIPFWKGTPDPNNPDDRWKDKDKRYDWSYANYPATIAKALTDFINGLNLSDIGITWEAMVDGTLPTTGVVPFNSVDILSAAASIASIFKCQYNFDFEKKKFYLGNFKSGSFSLSGEDPVTLKSGDNVGVASVTESKEDYHNAYFVQGSTRNLSKVSTNGDYVQVTNRLTLPTQDSFIYVNEKGQEITKAQFDASGVPLCAKSLIFDDVYPKYNLYLYNIRERRCWLLDENGNKIGASESDGWKDTDNNWYKYYSKWYFRFAYYTNTPVSGKTAVNEETIDGKTYYWYDYELKDNVKAKVSSKATQNGLITELPYVMGSLTDNNVTITCNNVTDTAAIMGFTQDGHAVFYVSDALYNAVSNGNTLIITGGLDSTKFDDKYRDSLIIKDKVLSLVFQPNYYKTDEHEAQTSPLTSREFELVYFNQAKNEKEADDIDAAGFDAEKGDFKIVPKEDSGLLLPTTYKGGMYPHPKKNLNSSVIPAGGSNYKEAVNDGDPSILNNIATLINIVVDDTSLVQAQSELREEALKQIAYYSQDLNKYSLPTNPVKYRETPLSLSIGQRATYNDGQSANGGEDYTLSTQIIKLVTRLDKPEITTVTVGNEKAKGTISTMKEQIETIIAGGIGGTSEGGGITESQFLQLLTTHGDKRYIRRDINDETDTSITANEFIAKQGIKTDEITPKTPNEPISMNGDVDISGDSNVEGTLESKGATSLAKQGGKTTMGGNAEIKGDADVAGDVTTNENYQEMTDNTDGIGARMTSDGRIFAWGMQQGDPENPFLGSHFRTVVFGRYIPGLITGTQSGAAIFDSGHAKFKSVAIGEFLEVPELRFNRATVSIGIGLRSKGGGIIEKVEIDQDGNGGWCRLKLEDGEYGAIEYNDFLLGFYHHEVLDANGDVDVNATIQSNSQANYDNHDGDYELCGFQSVYFRIDQIDAHQFDDEDEPVAATRNDRFHYVLRGNGGTSGRSYRNHPHESMHFALIANPSNTARQSLVVTTTEYEVRLMNLTNWNYTSNNIRSIDGKLDGFSMTSRYWDDATQQYVEYTKVFTGNGTVLGNAYIYGQLDQFERVGYRCYVEQSLNGSILPQDTETETVRVFNGYGEDVTHEFTRFSVTRDSGDAVSDAVWNAAHSNVSNPFQIAFSDLGIDGIYRTSVLFQVTATNVVSGTTTQGTTLEFSI